jgi:hypothetical protein
MESSIWTTGWEKDHVERRRIHLPEGEKMRKDKEEKRMDQIPREVLQEL